jgi:hypothetical protein
MQQQSWVKDGERLRGNYHGKVVEGVVHDSRVKYGGMVQYTVRLDTPVRLRWRSEPVGVVLLDESEVLPSEV